jgi:type I restriction enzyme S subunit
MIDWRTYNEASGVPSLSSKSIETIEVNMPEFDEQAAIAKTLSDFDFDLTQQGLELTKLRRLKAGMMQQLLTGKIRLV